jgi:hypothetical protein
MNLRRIRCWFGFHLWTYEPATPPEVLPKRKLCLYCGQVVEL